MCDGAEEVVLSEVHCETCPPGAHEWTTRFHFSLLSAAVDQQRQQKQQQSSTDEDGDLQVSRPAKHARHVLVRHSLATPLGKCGRQVWRGACLMADLLLARPGLCRGATVVELGAGVGLASVFAAQQQAKALLVTDADSGALRLAARNLAETAAAAAAGGDAAGHSERAAAGGTDVRMRGLDWFSFLNVDPWRLQEGDMLELLGQATAGPSTACGDLLPKTAAGTDCTGASAGSEAGGGNPEDNRNAQAMGRAQDEADTGAGTATQQQQQQSQDYCWRREDVVLLAAADPLVVLAADTVYDESLTEAFMHTAHALLVWNVRHQATGACRTAAMPDPARGAVEEGPRAAPPPQAEMGPASSGLQPQQAQQQRQPRMFVALERRCNFTLRDMDECAPAYEHFLTFVQQRQREECRPGLGQGMGTQRAGVQSQQQLSAGSGSKHSLGTADQACAQQPLLTGRRHEVDRCPQLLDYDRSPELELWELWLP